jgi:hypothetical protein
MLGNVSYGVAIYQYPGVRELVGPPLGIGRNAMILAELPMVCKYAAIGELFALGGAGRHIRARFAPHTCCSGSEGRPLRLLAVELTASHRQL